MKAAKKEKALLSKTPEVHAIAAVKKLSTQVSTKTRLVVAVLADISKHVVSEEDAQLLRGRQAHIAKNFDKLANEILSFLATCEEADVALLESTLEGYTNTFEQLSDLLANLTKLVPSAKPKTQKNKGVAKGRATRS